MKTISIIFRISGFIWFFVTLFVVFAGCASGIATAQIRDFSHFVELYYKKSVLMAIFGHLSLGLLVLYLGILIEKNHC